MKRASIKSYETYRNNYFKNLDKYGSMLSPVLDYNEYQAAYNDYYNARLEEGKDTKNINRLIINDQTFEYSITQGRAFKKVLQKLDNNMNLNISQLRQYVPDEFWSDYMEIYNRLKSTGEWIGFAKAGQTFSQFMSWYYWGSE